MIAHVNGPNRSRRPPGRHHYPWGLAEGREAPLQFHPLKPPEHPAGQPIRDRHAYVNPYVQRNRIILELGFPSYRAYLQSQLWRDIRSSVLSSGMKCECGAPAHQVHHAAYTYENLSGKNLHDLIPVCRFCHRRAEIASGKIRGLAGANQKLAQIAKRQRAWARREEFKARRRARLEKQGLDRAWRSAVERDRHGKDKKSPETLGGATGPQALGQGHDIQTSPTGASPDQQRSAVARAASLGAPEQEERGKPCNGPVVRSGKTPTSWTQWPPHGSKGCAGPSEPLASIPGDNGSSHQRLTRKGRWPRALSAKALAVRAQRVEADLKDRRNAERRDRARAQQQRLVEAYRASGGRSSSEPR